MTEFLTTGQMIDELKPGEKAKVVMDSNGILEGDIVINTGRQFKWDNTDIIFNIHDGVWGLKWEIVPKQVKYISFGEAMQALKEGKTIKCYNSGLVPHEVKYNIKESGHLREIHTERIIKGKWTIEEE